MSKMIFVNLPVKDLGKSMAFFKTLGFTFNPRFTDETAACMVVSETIFVMLLTEAKFSTFTPKKISDATKTTEVLVALSVETRKEVDETVRKAVAGGGTNRRTMGSCINTGFRTWTATFGTDLYGAGRG
ncbi:MAG TPA: hypothetical protein VML01_08800 [Bryobacterales bacterium]|nr:hypothetical protein [Bryobacterales bacterium]